MKNCIDLLRFVLFTMLAAVLYGVLHDLVTAQVCPAYFRPPYHPEVIASRSPIMLALTWGVIATWSAGLILGVIMGAANLLGADDPGDWGKLRRRVAVTLGAIWILAMFILIGAYFAARGTGANAALSAVATTHDWSYLASAMASLVIAVVTLRNRRGPASY